MTGNPFTPTTPATTPATAPAAAPTGTVTVAPAGPAVEAVAAVTDGSVAAGGEVYGPPIPFETIANLSDEELHALADKYGIDTTTGGPRGLLVQAIHQQMVAPQTAPARHPQDEPPTEVPTPPAQTAP
jgi:hypothetical protein